MRSNISRIVALTAAIRKQGPTDDLLRQAVILLADEVIHLSRELETVRSTAQRAERQSRMPVYGPVMRR